MKILIVEDELDLNENIAAFLQKEGYLCESATNFWQGQEKINLYEYDIILVDITLPGGSGLDLIRELKQIKTRVGVIIISARRALDDTIKGLDIGADDYIGKPFHLAELHARIRALFRRKFHQGSERICFEEIEIAPNSLEVFVNGKKVPFTLREYELVHYFIINKNRVLTKSAIVEHLWGDHFDMADSYDFLYNHIKNIRKKILACGGQDYLRTIYGLGYKYTAA